MTSRRTIKHLRKVLRDQMAAPVSIDQPHFLFDWPHDQPPFGEHQICVTPYDGHLADLKLAEWDFPVPRPALADVALGDLQLEPQL